MYLRQICVAVVGLFVLSGCMKAQSDSVQDIHTQTFVGRSAEHLAFRGATGQIHAQVYAGKQGGNPIYGLNIRRNASFSRWAHYNEAWSFGQKLGFSGGQSKIIFCASIGCDIVEYDQVTISDAHFKKGLKQGMQLRLLGSGDTTVINVPPNAFQEALAKMPR